ncbi:MAG: high-potential iron-sulfur protein [Caldimonas sp.]
MNSRRLFIRMAALTGAALLTAREALADAPVLDEKDPQAVALGYVADAARVNKAKYASYAPGQMCSTCQLFQGSAATALAPCPLYGGKKVAAKGWCSAYAKKVG